MIYELKQNIHTEKPMSSMLLRALGNVLNGTRVIDEWREVDVGTLRGQLPHILLAHQRVISRQVEAPAHRVLDELTPKVRHIVDGTRLLEFSAKAKAAVDITVALAPTIRAARCVTAYRCVAHGA